jgi:uncharacterized protein
VDQARPRDGAGVDAFRTFIVKTANRCNIDCDYCYVFHLADQTWRQLPARLSLDAARNAATRIAGHARAHRLPTVDIVFHGGEPLLVGPQHFEHLLYRIDGDALRPAT